MAPERLGEGEVRPPARKKQRRNNQVGDKVGDFVALDRLAWREVPFPEKFEDAEGFFGLEEISDIEVAKDEGVVGYRFTNKEIKGQVATTPKDILKSANQGPKTNQNGQEDGGEWEGFGDEHESPSPQNFESTKRNGSTISIKTHAAVESTGGLSKGGFGALQDVKDDSADISQWNDLDLSQETASSLARMAFTKPTAIQRAAIPEIIAGHDVIGKAPTGSGKTLAFGIPILESFLTKREAVQEPQAGDGSSIKHILTALIISPTRELAHQISTHLGDLCSVPDAPAIATVTGGLSAHKQQRLLANADIVVGTPGRLWELMSGNDELRKKLRHVNFLVMDEADRLLSEGHFQELSEIVHALDPEYQDSKETEGLVDQDTNARQTLVFSATFQKDLQRKLSGKSRNLASELLDERESMDYLLKKLKFREAKPKFVDVNPDHQMAENLTERILECAALEKDLYLYAVLLHHAKARTLVFVNSIGAVRRLVPLLQNLKFPTHALHSQMPQKARLRSIERFSSSSSTPTILVASDVAARGLDIPSVQLIVHYHVPHAADMYVHRSGRTARAEHSGSSILLCSPDEVQSVRRLIAKVHARAEKSDKKHLITTIELDSRVIARTKNRVTLSKKITDAALAKEKHGQEDNWLRNAAEELGVDYDSEEFAANQGSQKGRGQGRKNREKEARGLSKEDLASLRVQLKEEMKTRINVGVSERYLTAGGLDIDELLQEKEQGLFLGKSNLDDFAT